MTVLGSKQFLKQGYPEAIVKVVFFFLFVCLFVCFFKIVINIDRGKGEGGVDICCGTVPTLLARIVVTLSSMLS